MLGVSELFIAGGAQIYEAAIKFCTRIYITEVHASPEGDVFFPKLDWNMWREVSREYHESENSRPAYSFVVYE